MMNVGDWMKKIYLGAITIVLMAYIATSILVDQWQMPMMYHHYFGSREDNWLFYVNTVLLWILVFGTVIYVIGFLNQSHQKNYKEILKERLAKGEISIEQYEELVDLLKER